MNAILAVSCVDAICNLEAQGTAEVERCYLCCSDPKSLVRPSLSPTQGPPWPQPAAAAPGTALPAPQEKGQTAWAPCSHTLLAVLPSTAIPSQSSWAGKGALSQPLLQHSPLELAASTPSWASRQRSQVRLQGLVAMFASLICVTLQQPEKSKLLAYIWLALRHSFHDQTFHFLIVACCHMFDKLRSWGHYFSKVKCCCSL